MSQIKHTEVRARLETLLWSEQTMDPAECALLHEHLRGCAACRAHYDRMALALRALEPEAERAGAEQAFGEASFLSALGAQLAAEQAPASEEPAAPVISLAHERARRVALACVALAACGLAVWGAQRAEQAQQAQDEEFTARSAQTREQAVPEVSPASVAVFCVTRAAAGTPRFEGASDAPLGALACDVGGELQVAYTLSAGHRARYAAFFGVSEADELLWYGPSPAEPGPVAVTLSEGLSPVGQTIRLGVNHQPGMVRVFGLFSEEPLELARVQRWVARPGAWRGEDGPLAARREGVLVVESSFEVVEESTP
jgi:predicted anti-sigma-YlaC factor YlaD